MYLVENKTVNLRQVNRELCDEWKLHITLYAYDFVQRIKN